MSVTVLCLLSHNFAVAVGVISVAMPLILTTEHVYPISQPRGSVCSPRTDRVRCGCPVPFATARTVYCLGEDEAGAGERACDGGTATAGRDRELPLNANRLLKPSRRETDAGTMDIGRLLG